MATEKNGTVQSAEEENRIITFYEAADILCLSYGSVRRLVLDGELRALRMRHSWRTTIAYCNEYIKRQEQLQAILCNTIQKD